MPLAIQHALAAPPRKDDRWEDRWPVVWGILDALHDGVVVCDRLGTVLHANRAFRAVRDSDAEASRIHEEVEGLIRSLTLLQRSLASPGPEPPRLPLTRHVGTCNGLYRLEGSYLSTRADAPATDPALLVLLTALVPEPLTNVALHARFGLTDQQIRTVRLLAEGRTNKEIGRELHISTHTVRHHIEHLLTKLGIHSRGEAALIIFRGTPPPGTGPAGPSNSSASTR